MSAVKIFAFGGMVPAVDDRLLPENAAARSENAWLYSGVAKGMAAPVLLRALDNVATSKVYRIPNNFNDADHLNDATWMEFEDPDTDVLRSQVVGDTHERFYWANPTEPPMYNSRARLENGDPGYLLGVPAPSVAPGVTPSGGVSGTNRTTAYVYTWVTTFGEEGPPSPPTVDTDKIDATWAITVTAPDPDDVGGPDRDISHVRIYRTVTSGSGVATFFLVTEQVIADTTYDDTASDATVSANSELESTDWSGPPTDLVGWVSMPNGIFAGWRSGDGANEVWFSEPYRPHAWPARYTLAVNYPIVGLGVIGQTLVVATQSYPVAISGIHPASMSQSQIMSLESCLSRGSILSSPEGVYYASPNGLVLVSQGRAMNITKDLITKERWQGIVGTTTLATLRAARLGSAYYAFGSVRPGVFEPTAFETTAFTQLDFTGALNGILVDPTNQRVAFGVLSNSVPVVMVQNDVWTGELFAIRDENLYWINIAEEEPAYESFLWRSKIFQSPYPAGFAAMRVYFEIPATAPVLNPVRNTNIVQTLAADQYGLVRFFADEVLVSTRELRTSGELFRIPSGFKSDFVQVEIEARVRVLSLQLGTSIRALARV